MKRFWVFLFSSIDKGETPMKAALRELREETGIDTSPVNLRQIDDFETGVFCCAVYIAETEGPALQARLRQDAIVSDYNVWHTECRMVSDSCVN